MADKTIKIKITIQYGEDDFWVEEINLQDPNIPYMREGEFIISHKIQNMGDKIIPLALKEITKKFPNANT